MSKYTYFALDHSISMFADCENNVGEFVEYVGIGYAFHPASLEYPINENDANEISTKLSELNRNRT